MNSDLLKHLALNGYKLADRAMPNKRLVQDWWPSPIIKPLPESLWGDKWSNVGSGGLLHKYECSSFSAMGFHHENERNQMDGLPKCKCLAYGETPEQAYNRWCEVFNSWNKKEEWVK